MTTAPDPATLGAVIKRLRGIRTRRDVAGAARVTEATLVNVEHGRVTNPHPATLHGIAEALGTTLTNIYLECHKERSC